MEKFIFEEIAEGFPKMPPIFQMLLLIVGIYFWILVCISYY